MAKTSILIIEDEPKVALFIKKGLEENTFEAKIAYEGRDGIELALGGNHDLVILDLNLPDVSGYEVCKEYLDK